MSLTVAKLFDPCDEAAPLMLDFCCPRGQAEKFIEATWPGLETRLLEE